MDVVSALDPAVRAALGEHTARLKHDLGKYVSLQARWLPPDASPDERRAALAADLLTTRRGPEGEVDAVALWRELRRPLVGEADLDGGGRADIAADPAVAAIDAAMVVLEGLVPALRAGTAADADVRRGAEAAATVAEACRDLHRRVRG